MAGQEMWLTAAQQLRGKQLTDISRPVDQALQTAFDLPEVRYHPSRPSRNKGKGKSKGVDLPSGCVPETPSKQFVSSVTKSGAIRMQTVAAGDCMFAGRQAAMESIRAPGATAAELQRKGRKRFGRPRGSQQKQP